MSSVRRVIQSMMSFIMISLGAVLASFSVACILLPNDAIDYGTAGIAIIISKLTGYNLSLCVLVVFLPFLIGGLLLLGKRFFLRAAVGSVVYMIGLEYFERIPFELNVEHYLAVVFGGAILGAGLSLILRFGGCIDGSEILSDDVSFRLEPFYLEDARTFDEDYLNGFYSNTSDITYSDLRAAASEHCHRMYAEEVVKSVKANNVKIVDSLYWADIQDDPVYMMMPVWFFTFRHEEKPYTILVNGQTGRVVGTMPWKTKSVWAFAISLFVLLLGLIGFAQWAALGRGNDLASVAMYIVIAMLAGGFALTATGFNGIRRVMNNLKLTQSESMFRYVKRRQG